MTINGYDIELVLNKAIADEFDPSGISFSLRDSIYDLYCTGTFSIIDTSGLLLEARAFSEGIPFDISFGFLGVFLKNNYYIHKMEAMPSDSALQLSGRIELELTHSSAKEHLCDSRAFDPVPSDIVTQLYTHQFEDEFIEKTKSILPSDKMLYQPRINQKEFIEKILLPNSLSSGSTASPYYCFINSKNQLHFESFVKMWDRAPYTTLYLNREKKVPKYFQKILGFIPFTFDLERHRNVLDFTLEGFTDEEDPQMTLVEHSIMDFGEGPFPIYEVPEEVRPWFTGIDSFPDQDLARVLHKQRYAVCPDKVLVTIPLNTELASGMTVNIDVEYSDRNTSYSYEGKYLIERTDHVWNGESISGYTQLVLGKKAPSFPSNSSIERGMKQ